MPRNKTNKKYLKNSLSFNFKVVLIVIFTLLAFATIYKTYFTSSVETNIVTPPSQIKTLTFNTGPTTSFTGTPYQKYQALANFIKQQGIEVVALQEQKYKTDGTGDGDLFKQALKDAGYQMNIVQVVELKNEGNIIASKYPFVPNTYKEFLISGERNRIIQQIAVQTPYGKLWVVNVHTNTARSCGESLQVLDQLTLAGGYFAPPANDNVVIMGDFNVYLDLNGKVTVCEYSNQISSINNRLTYFKTNCTTGVCSNRNDPKIVRIIDWVITTASSPVTINSAWSDNTVKYIGDGHPVILGLIDSTGFTKSSYDYNKNGLIDINDVITFIRDIFTSNNLNLIYDFNLDGIINILDVLVLVKVIFS